MIYSDSRSTMARDNSTLSLDLHLAHTYFNNEQAVATTGYYDYIVGLVIGVDGFTSEVAYTNTFDRTNLVNNQYAKTDGTFTVMISKLLQVF